MDELFGIRTKWSDGLGFWLVKTAAMGPGSSINVHTMSPDASRALTWDTAKAAAAHLDFGEVVVPIG